MYLSLICSKSGKMSITANITRMSRTDVESVRISIVCTEDVPYDVVAFLPNGRHNFAVSEGVEGASACASAAGKRRKLRFKTFHMPNVYVTQNK